MKNWKTTLFGSLTALAAGIVAAPDLAAYVFPPEHYPDIAMHIVTACKGIAVVSGILFAASSKDHNATGGTKDVGPQSE